MSSLLHLRLNRAAELIADIVSDSIQDDMICDRIDRFKTELVILSGIESAKKSDCYIRGAKGRFAGSKPGCSKGRSSGGKGGGKTKAPQKERTLGQQIFPNSKHAKLFDREFEKYSKMSKEKMLNEWENSFHEFRSMLDMWQLSTTDNSEAVFLKDQAKYIEKLPGSIRVDRNSGYTSRESYVKSNRKQYPKLVSINEYIRARALAQAYMRKNYRNDTITLYRGTDGRTGRRIASNIKKSSPKYFHLEEDPLVGYSSHKGIAKMFGVEKDGLTVRRKIPIKDILFPHQFLNPIYEEKEFIVRNNYKWTRLSHDDIMLP